MRFVHTADWHIGKSFGTFPADAAALLRHARERAVEAVAAAARAHGAENVLVAGDTFDSQGLSDAVLRSLLSILGAAGDLRWHMLPGNHDADQPRGIWERIARLGLPANVIVHREQKPVRVNDQLVLLPAPLRSKQVEADPTAWFGAAERPQGVIVVGLAHGSTQDFGGDGTPGVLIPQSRAAQAGLDYLALGDWHGTMQVNSRTWFSGSPEPSSFVDNDAGNALVVELEGPGAVPRVEPVKTGQYNWCRIAADLTNDDAAGDVVRRLEALGEVASRTVARLRLSGRIGLQDHVAFTERLDVIGPGFLTFEVRDEGLEIEAGRDLSDVFQSPDLVDIADRLAMQTGDRHKDDVNNRALELLGRFALRARE